MVETLFLLLQDVVENHFPAEASAFEVVGRDLIRSQLSNRDDDSKEDPSAYGFAQELDTGLLIVHLVAGTLSLIEVYLAASRLRTEKQELAELQKLWETYLVRNNIPPTLASWIPARHAADLLRVIIETTNLPRD
jgi:hypothetical protein